MFGRYSFYQETNFFGDIFYRRQTFFEDIFFQETNFFFETALLRDTFFLEDKFVLETIFKHTYLFRTRPADPIRLQIPRVWRVLHSEELCFLAVAWTPHISALVGLTSYNGQQDRGHNFRACGGCSYPQLGVHCLSHFSIMSYSSHFSTCSAFVLYRGAVASEWARLGFVIAGATRAPEKRTRTANGTRT